MARTILVVDDERNIRDLVRLYLEGAGYVVDEAADGPSAIERHARGAPDLVILDLMLPGLDGMEVTREIRRHAETPILMLTARAEEIDRILGLELGADDYLPKPFHPRELVARVKAILRRTDPAARAGRPLVAGDLRIDPRRREVTNAGVPLTLRPREFDLLAALARDPGVVWSRDDLLTHVWGTDYPGETRTVDVHVSALRTRLGPDGPAIEAVKGVGYRLVPRRAVAAPEPEPRS
ncbi:MAG: response regulator transcription factor [Chloroflexota bacterium]